MPKPFVIRDRFAKKARLEGYLARSAFKLQEINRRFGVIRPGDKALDLGAAPGSWLQVASALVEKRGLVVGVDKEPIKFNAPNVKTIMADVLDDKFLAMIRLFGGFDVVLSDLAPATSGIKSRDQAQSQELADRALAIADAALRRHGALVVKVFQSAATGRFVNQLKKTFKTVRIYKPEASRDRSFETYLIALKKID